MTRAPRPWALQVWFQSGIGTRLTYESADDAMAAFACAQVNPEPRSILQVTGPDGTIHAKTAIGAR